MSYLRSHEGPMSLRDLFLRAPSRARIMLDLADAVLRDESSSELTVAQRELIFAYGSGVNACDFCFNSHKYTAAEFGVDEGLFEKLMDDVDTAPVEDSLKPVLRFVRKLTLTPSRVTQQDADTIYDAGWSEEAFFDVVSICALHNMYNRLVDGTGVDVGDDEWRASGKRLGSIGYRGTREIIEKALGERQSPDAAE